MNKEQTLAAIEAVLFSIGDEMPVSDLAQTLNLSEAEMQTALDELAKRCESEDRGIRLLRLEERVQLCAKPDYIDTLIKVVNKPRTYELTETLLETLAIIAYRQPVTRLDVEKIRGVKSDYSINQLIEFGLICEKGRMDAPGRPLLFGTTDEFLRHFGFESVDDMPTFGRDDLERFRADAEQQAGVVPGEKDERP